MPGKLGERQCPFREVERHLQSRETDRDEVRSISSVFQQGKMYFQFISARLCPLKTLVYFYHSQLWRAYPVLWWNDTYLLYATVRPKGYVERLLRLRPLGPLVRLLNFPARRIS